MSQIIEKINNYFLNDGVILARSITIVILGYLVIKLIIGILKKQVNRSKVEKTLPNFLISILNIFLMAILVIFVLKQCGVSTDSVVTIASVLSLGISLALQDVISAFANGLIIVTTKPFSEGEYVSIGGICEGTVVSISMFHTILKTADGLMVTVPNSMVTGNYVKNFSRLPTRRVDIYIPIGYSVDVSYAKETVFKILENTSGLLKDPKPSLNVTEYEDSNVALTLKVWVPGDLYWDTKFSLQENILNEFKAKNISIDYNQLDVHIKNDKEEL